MQVQTIRQQLLKLNLKYHTGNRVEFLTRWFGQLQLFNHAQGNPMDPQDVWHTIMDATKSDEKLRTIFATIPYPSHQDDSSVHNLQHKLLQHAILLDDMDSNNKSKTNVHQFQDMFQAYQVHTDDSSDDNHCSDVSPLDIPHDIHAYLASQDHHAQSVASNVLAAYKAHLNPDLSINKAQLDPSLRIPSDVYKQLSLTAKRIIAKDLPEEDRKILVQGLTASPALQAHTHDSRQVFAAKGSPDISSLTTETSPLSKSSSSRSSSNRPPASASTTKISKNSSDSGKPSKSHLGIGHLACMMANNKPSSSTRQANAHLQYYTYPSTSDDDHSPIHNDTYQANLHMLSPAWESDNATVTYSVSKHITQSAQDYGLVDGGANGIIAGEECIWIGGPSHPRKVNVTGIDQHQLNNIPVGTVGSLSISNRGPVILIINEAAYTGKHTSILSRIQIEAYNNCVDNQPLSLGGRQRIITPEGYVFPLSIISGLPYLKMQKYTQHEYDTLPHVILTSDQAWNPRSCDKTIDPEDPRFYELNLENLDLLPNDSYNIVGEYIGNQAIANPSISPQDSKDLIIQRCVYATRSTPTTPNPTALESSKPPSNNNNMETTGTHNRQVTPGCSHTPSN